jgi:hypothetical protein
VVEPAVIPTINASSGGVMFVAGMVVDGDGAPNCYAPEGSGLQSLDYLGNAMDGPRFVGVVCTPQGDPIVQGPNDPCPGYYVSPTSLADKTKALSDPLRYVDASVVPYVSICPELRAHGVDLGDIAIVSHKGLQTGAIVADISPHNHYGEASIACAAALRIPSSAKNGGVSGGVTYVLFPGSRAQPGWPRDLAEIQATAASLFAAWSAPATAGA